MKSLYIYYPNSKNIFKITSSNVELLSKLKNYLGSIVYSRPINFIDIIDIKVLYFSLSVYKNHILVYEFASNDYLILFSKILEIVRKYLDFYYPWYAFHGSTLKIDNDVIMFLAPTHGGKTTLSTFLTYKTNVELISEDITIVNFINKEIAGITKPLFLRKESYELLSDKYKINFNNNISFWNYGDLRVKLNSKQISKNKYELSKIILLTLDQDETSVYISRDFAKLFSNSYCYNSIKESIGKVTYIYKDIPIYEMHYYDLNDAYCVIKKLVNMF